MKKHKKTKLAHLDLWEEVWRSNHSPESVRKLIEAWIPLVHHILNRISIRLPSHIQREDLFQCAVVGLYEAIERFDPSVGVTFQTFSSRRIRGSILDELRNNDHMTRSSRTRYKQMEVAIQQWTDKHGYPPDEEELASMLNLTQREIANTLELSHPWLSLDQAVMSGRDGQKTFLKDILPDSNIPLPDDEAMREDARKLLRESFRKLATREQKIMYLYYFEDLKLSEIAALFEVTEARICQIHALVISKLKAYLKQYELRKAS